MTPPFHMRMPRPFPDPARRIFIRKLAAMPAPADNAVIKSAATRLIGWDDSARVSFEKGFQNFLDFLVTVRYERENVPEGNSGAVVLGVCCALAQLYAARMPLKRGNLELLIETADIFEKPERSGDYILAHMAMYIRLLATSYSVRLRAIESLARLDAGPLLDQARGLDVAGACLELAEAISGLRSYGVKSCLIADGFFHKPRQAWIFSDSSQLRLEIDPQQRLGMAPALAATWLTDRDQIRQLQPKYERVARGSLSARQVTFDFTQDLTAVVQPDGAITADVEYGVVPGIWMFEEARKAEAYDLFRLIELLRLFDLVVPVEVVRSLNAPWPQQPGNRREHEEYRRVLPGLFRSLLIPRLRLLQSQPLLRKALDHELAQAQQHTNQLTGRPVARHEVVWMVRRLPPGCEATPEARRRAWQERGIVLPEGTTYVRSHWRGLGKNPSIGHTARRRR